MAGAGNTVVTAARALVGDNNAARPVIAQDDFRRAVNRQVAFVAKKLGLGPAWDEDAITLTTADYDYTLPTSVEYNQVIALAYASDRRPLDKRSPEEIRELRSGTVSAHGRSYLYAMDFDSSGRAVVMLPYLPNHAETLDAYVSTMPAQWAAGPGTPPSIPFSETALRALELLVAAAVVKPLGSDKMTALDLSAKAADDWISEAMELLREERLTVIRMKRARGPRNYAWFRAWGGAA